MNAIDRLRIERAVLRHDFWLDVRGVRGRRRKEMRNELRANLVDASREGSTSAALRGVGSPRELAFAASPEEQARPRWSFAAIVTGLVCVLLGLGIIGTAIAVHQTTEAAGVTDAVQVTTPPWLGFTFSAQAGGGSDSIGVVADWYVALVPLAIFLLVAKPWRLARRG